VECGGQSEFDFTIDPKKVVARGPQEMAPNAADFRDLLIFAVQEQLGFKLERQKAPLEITVIDQAERPAEN
jgi:uncharacterized protein (TIGR03435 family)